MIRTQIQLPERDYERLREAAQRQHRSLADCIREGIGLYLRSAEAAVADLSEVAGRFTPRPIDDLKSHDRAWIETQGRP